MAIRLMHENELETVLTIWLDASINAHDFLAPQFWESQIDAMREEYLPSAENYIYEENNEILGFFSLHENMLAAIFVTPNAQGRGIGQAMLNYAKSLYNPLFLNVYERNERSYHFYEQAGFYPIEENMDLDTREISITMRFDREGNDE